MSTEEPTTSGSLDAQEILDAMRRSRGGEFLPARKKAEAEARDLLDRKAGQMTAAQAWELAQVLNRHSDKEVIKHNRFTPGLSKPLVDQMVADIDWFNQVTLELWRANVERALEVVGEIFSKPGYLPGAGRSYPTILLYLRDPDRFAMWFPRLDGALALVSEYPGHSGTPDLDAYLVYCQNVKELRQEYGVEAEEVDAFLWEVAAAESAQAIQRKEFASIPSLEVAAFQFLAELAENNNKDWLDANRERYQNDLRDRLASVFEYVAAKYLRSLDPKLETEVKRDVVMARMNKWTQGDPYYEYLWGAFSRGKKQEDVQLFVNIGVHRLRFGLYLGSASSEQRERIVRRADEIEPLLSRLKEEHPDLRWEPKSREEPILVRNAESVAQWASGPDPEVAVALAPDDELVGTERLADVIGRVLVDLHPIAAIAWGDEVELPVDPGDVDTSRPVYTLAEFVADTHLPAEQLEEWAALLAGEKKAALFYGPPGTGKTHVASLLARYVAGTEGEVRSVQFHPSFSYEDFIEGLRPVVSDAGMLGYEVRPGIFKRYCDTARGQEAPYVFLIDEINRADLGSVLGEVMTLLEYRGKTVPLPYSHELFSIPDNIVVLATMNTADRSLALVDFALRRRFHAFQMSPSREVLQSALGPTGMAAVKMFDIVQRFVDNDDFAPGHSYWMANDASPDALQRIWKYEIRPYLQEYWFESKARLDELERTVNEVLAYGP